MSEVILSCPHCPAGKTPKLYVNVEMGVYNCYRCGFKGRIKYLYKYPEVISKLEEQMTLAEYNKLKTFKPLETKNVDILKELNPVREVFFEDPQYDYLLFRGWTPDLIDLYRPLVSLNPRFKDRVILPVIENDNIIYYTARSMDPKATQKYKNPSISRKTVIFKSLIPESVLFPKDVVIGEGIFDMYKVPNGLGLLGKTVSEENESQLLDILASKDNIYICLDAGAEVNIQRICSKIYSWFPHKHIYYIDTTKYGEKDLGDLSKELTSIEMLHWIKSNSKSYKPASLLDSLRSKILVMGGN
jgi:hypothetical protein